MQPETVVRRHLFESFGSAPTRLGVTLRAFPRKMWIYKDSASSQSIHDLVWQFADDEVIEYIYCRRFAGDLGASPLALDASGIASSPEYFYQNTKEAMRIIRALRLAAYRFIGTLPHHVWDSAIELPTYGKVALSDWLQLRDRYASGQIQKMSQIYGAWLATRFDPDQIPAPYASVLAHSIANTEA
ncbi:MAG TPA: hypothetical protein VNO32_17790 [Candidatus Acidoferrum sp.]|jgi:hypothetical protein|nr:hypothetical protein [Candidatus Acidoferrum sp.]